MKTTIRYEGSDNSIEAKARWFQSLAVEERMQWLDETVEAALASSPELAHQDHGCATNCRVRVIELPRGPESPAGRAVAIENALPPPGG